MRVTLPALCGLRWVECAPLSDGFLFSDAQALAYANRAGGTRLLELYAKTAAARGYGLAVTDAVLFEVLHGKDPVVAWMERELAAGRLTLVSTQEIELLELHREGRAPPHYQPRNAGERSIIEAVTADSKRAPSHAIFSDDRNFRNNQLMAAHAKATGFLPEKIVYTNPEMLNSALHAQTITAEEFQAFRQSYRDNVNVFKSGTANYSPALDKMFANDAQVDSLASRRPSAGLRLLGGFGKAFAVAGAGFIAVEAMTTAAKAAGELEAGKQREAARTVTEFGARMAGALVMGQEFALIGATLGSVVPGLGTTIGGLAGGAIGGILGAAIGDSAAKHFWERIDPQVAGAAPAGPVGHGALDPRLTDELPRDYPHDQVRALQQALYEDGHGSAAVNLVCTAVHGRIIGSSGPGPAPVAEALDGLARNFEYADALRPPSLEAPDDGESRADAQAPGDPGDLDDGPVAGGEEISDGEPAARDGGDSIDTGGDRAVR